MRYVFAVIADQNSPSTAGPDEMAAIDAFNEKIESAGQRILAVGIAHPSSAVVFDNRNGTGQVSLGPVVDAAEFVAGLWIIEAASEQVAHELAAEASLACNRRIEVRPLLG